MNNKNSKLIVLILIGACLVILFICGFTLLKIKQSSETNAERVSNNVEENTVVENTVEKVEVKEKEVEEENKTEESNEPVELNYENVVDWPEEEIEQIKFDTDKYEKDVNTYAILQRNGDYLITFDIPTDFPVQPEEYNKEKPSERLSLNNSDIGMHMSIDGMDYSTIPPKNVDNETTDGEVYKEIKKVKINSLTGVESYRRSYNVFDSYSSYWFLAKSKSDTQALAVEITVGTSNGHNEEEYSIEEFLKSDDYKYFLSSFKIYKNGSEVFKEVMKDVEEKESTYSLSDPYREIEIFDAEDFIDDETEILTYDINSIEKDVEQYVIEDTTGKYKLEFSMPKSFPFHNNPSDHTQKKFFLSEGNSINLSVEVYYGNAFATKYVERETYGNNPNVLDFRKYRINRLTGYELYSKFDENEMYYYSSIFYLTPQDSDGKRLIAQVDMNKRYNSTEELDIKDIVNSDDFKYLLASIKVYEHQ